MYLVLWRTGPYWDDQHLYYTKSKEWFDYIQTLHDPIPLSNVPKEIYELLMEELNKADGFLDIDCFWSMMDALEEVDVKFPVTIYGHGEVNTIHW